jgi:hypothetical protein
MRNANVQKILVTLVLMLSVSGIGQQQPKSPFTSVYTNLNKDCKFSESTEGQDPVGICKGYGGYQLGIYFSAMSAHLNAYRGKNSISLSGGFRMPLDYDEQPGRKIEWRLHNGVPFAVIFRLDQYQFDGDQTFTRTGTLLHIVGLIGFERIRQQINALTPKVNLQAQALADAAYTKLQTK